METERNLIEKTPAANSDFLHWLQNELSLRCRKNQRYSLRSFAKLLDVEASTLSQLLAGKRKVTNKTVRKFCKKLNVPLEMEQAFIKGLDQKVVTPNTYSPVHIDSFNVIADWYHTVILEMTEQKDFVADVQKISSRLGITTLEAKMALERLLRLGLLIEKDGRLQKANKKLTNFKPGETSRAHRLLQKQIIEKASEAVDQIEPEFKDITAMFMSIDESKIPEARLAIQRFRQELCELLEEGEQTRVYSLAVQLIPLENKKDEL